MNTILRQVYIYKDGELIYTRQFGKALSQETFDGVFKQLYIDAFKVPKDQIEYHDYYKYRITYATSVDLNIIFLFVTGLTDSSKDIKNELHRCKREFLNLFGDVINDKFDPKTFEVFDPTIDLIHKNLRPKISLVGFSGVGKTTITRLIRAEEIPMEHIPTITGDIATIKIGKLHFHLWDFAGQEQFSYLWNNFVRGSDAVLLITDSTLENIEKSKFFLDLIKDEAPHAHTAIIGNKQDLSDALPVMEIEKILGLKTYKMIANRKENRNKMITIIADILEMSSEVSPLLKPLIDRDRSLKEAEKALNEGNFQKALTLFENIADLCIDLGDDSLGNEFHEKAQKIRVILKKIEKVPVEIVKPAKPKPAETQKPSVPKPPKAPKLTTLEPAEIEKPSILKPPKAPKPAGPEPELTPPKITINLDDFKIKPRPTNILSATPAGPKSSLKISPFGTVEQQPQPQQKSKPYTTKVESPYQQPLPTSTKPTQPVQTPAEAKTPEEILKEPDSLPATPTLSVPSPPTESSLDTTQKGQLEKTLMDLRIKLANISKMELDLEMKEISGEISTEEFNKKSQKIKALKQNVLKQIDEIQTLLNNFSA